jgi:DNA replication protein DnaC
LHDDSVFRWIGIILRRNFTRRESQFLIQLDDWDIALSHIRYDHLESVFLRIADAALDGTRKEHMEFLVTVPLLIIDDLGMLKLPLTAAEELLEIIMRRYERASTILTSNRPVEDWGKLLGDAAAVSAMLDRLIPHGHVLKCGPRSWRTKLDAPGQ